MSTNTLGSTTLVARDLPAVRARMLWLDAVKGIGIIAVVWGHVIGWPDARFAYLWHMPLFFFLAGYVYRPDRDVACFFKDKAFRLLVPYAAFLIILSCLEIPMLVGTNTGKDWLRYLATHVSGGKSIYGWFAPFWFITCLYLSLQLVNFFMARCSRSQMRWLAIASLLLSYAHEALLPGFWLPWAAHICLFAVPLVYAGYEYRHSAASGKTLVSVLAVLIAAAGFVLVWKDWIAVPDMKITHYGTPIVAALCSLCVVIALMVMSQRWLAQGLVASILAYLGRASLIIMFLHMLVKETAKNEFHVDSAAALVSLSVLLPLIAFAILDRTPATRAIFLGVPRPSESLN